MAIRWYKIKHKLNRNRYFLHTICAGFVFYFILSVIGLIWDGSICPVYYCFGKRCLGCGMTRAFHSLFLLDFRSAVKYNALSLPLFIGTVVYILFGFADIIFDKQYLRSYEKILANKYMYYVYLLMVLLGGYVNGLFAT